MTDRGDNQAPAVSNDKVVNEIIEDFKETCDISEEAHETSSVVGDSEKDKELAGDKKPHRDDYIDEAELKDKELTYSEEEKDIKRQEAVVLKTTGNELYKAGKFKESLDVYTLALRTCPLAYPKERSILFANRAAGKMNMDLKESAIEDCTMAIQLDPGYVKALLRRGQLYEKMEKLDEALEDYKKVVEIAPSVTEARQAVARLPGEINERNEKLKEEMIGKLKDLGNLILKPFGLSTNSFQLNKDSESGGYNISFKS